MRVIPAPLGAGLRGKLAFDQADVTGTRTLGGFLDLKLHPLSLAKQFEHCAADRAAVKEMFKATLITDEPETFIDEEASDSAGHNRCPPTRVSPETIPGNSPKARPV